MIGDGADNSAISVWALGKRYSLAAIRHRGSLAERLAGFFHGAGTPIEGEEGFWALRDVTFDVAPGEVVGVLGRNGSGKSTLMKILARITAPTEGQAILRGRVGALLEVGTGFHPDLTGRENVFLSGSILGLSRREISRRLDEIIAFAEIDAFIDLPVKHYSSGMFMRLAFSVTAHLDAEIMLIDEVLAIGDVGFERKSVAKIREIVRTGRTVLFISHDLPAVRDLCQRCIVLDHGRLDMAGPPDPCIAQYEALCRANPLPQTAAPATLRPLRRA